MVILSDKILSALGNDSEILSPTTVLQADLWEKIDDQVSQGPVALATSTDLTPAAGRLLRLIDFLSRQGLLESKQLIRGLR